MLEGRCCCRSLFSMFFLKEKDGIRDGTVTGVQTCALPISGTSMPDWSDVLKEQERWDLVAYIKSFAGLEQPAKPPIDYKNQVKSSAESIEKGKEIFKNMCSECHGEEGKGDATKKLKDDLGFRT